MIWEIKSLRKWDQLLLFEELHSRMAQVIKDTAYGIDCCQNFEWCVLHVLNAVDKNLYHQHDKNIHKLKE